jgi:hypothetical protein
MRYAKAATEGFWERDHPGRAAERRDDDGGRLAPPRHRAGQDGGACSRCSVPDGASPPATRAPSTTVPPPVIIMSDTKAKELGLEPLARIVSTGVSALNPEIMGLGPVEATKQALGHAGMSHRRHRRRRDQRGVRRPGHPVGARARHRLRQAQPPRRVDRRRPPVRHDRRAHHRHPHQRSAAPSMGRSVWRPCASAVVRAWRWCWNGLLDPVTRRWHRRPSLVASAGRRRRPVPGCSRRSTATAVPFAARIL